MSNICESFEETIWEHARTGARLSAQAQSHIDQCENCQQTLRQATQIMSAVLSADCVPHAPDCRQAVMARIAPPVKRPRLAWAYACAGLAFAGISALAIVNMFTLTAPTKPIAKAITPKIAAKPAIEQPNDNLTKEGVKLYAPTLGIKNSKSFRISVVHKIPRRTNDASYMVAKLPDSPGAITRDFRTGNYRVIVPTTAGHAVYSSSSTKTDSIPGYMKADEFAADNSFKFHSDNKLDAFKKSVEADGAMKDNMPNLEEVRAISVDSLSDMKLETHYDDAAKSDVGNRYSSEKRKTTEIATTDRPVAIAVVHWSTPVDTPENSYSYNYSDRDTTTGEVTKCSVTRTGDTVEIRLESEPEIKDPSKRGSINYETLAKA